ncbi:MAG: nucleotide exchange factor GrpE [Kiritimatiellae bacterium]|nr:nucleotide exchange factor GrpE [Kiritimatiellia bacterium]
MTEKEDPKPVETSESDNPEEPGQAEGSPAESDASAQPGEAAEKPAEPQKPAEPDWKTLYALTLADFDNYKKRAARDREDSYRFAEADILSDVLPAVDNLQLALANAAEKKDDPFVKGVQLVYDTLLKSLKDHGAEPFDSVGKELDTERMEAIATLPSEDVEEGKVSIESKKGWMLKGKVLRIAQVVVSSGKPA